MIPVGPDIGQDEQDEQDKEQEDGLLRHVIVFIL